jgi:hypothetical protein
VAVVVSGIDERARTAITELISVSTSYFRLEASGLSNADPTGATPGGIGQTLSVLVKRTQKANQTQNGRGDGGLSWTFRRLDWQKEAGARLFREPDSGLSDSEDETDDDETDEDDADFSDN